MTIKDITETHIHPITGWKPAKKKKYSKLTKSENEIRKYYSENYEMDRNKMAY